MHLALWMNGAGLVLGIVAAFVLAYYPLASVTFVTEKGERILQFTSTPTPKSLRQMAHERRMARLGGCLLLVAFALQLIALVLPRWWPASA